MKLNNFGIVAVRHKANILAVGLFCVDKAAFLRNFSRFLLAHSAKRKQRAGKLLLRHGIKHIALVFCRVNRFFKQVFATLLLNSGIVTGGNMVAA